MMSQALKRIICVIFLLNLCHSVAHAHKPSDSYLGIQVANNTAAGQWDIALRDLDFAIGLDVNANSEITWQEVQAKQPDIFAYALARLSFKNQQAICDLTPTQLLIDSHTDGAYAVINFNIACTKNISNLNINYSLFADIDPTHRGLLRLEYVEKVAENSPTEQIKISKSAILGPDNASQSFVLSAPNRLNEFKQYVIEGIWHIWIGYDHILFLISLLLPAVLIYTEQKWHASPQFKPAFVQVLKIVTAFTVAHSITLTLATLQIIVLPSRWVEATIAASVILAALNNLYPMVLKRMWLVAFAFGLVHGFGFAAVLNDLGLQKDTLTIALVGFNVGVEIGQIGIVSLFVPIAYFLRKTQVYQRIVFAGGSVLIALLASIWFVERTFNLVIFPVVADFIAF
jgi:HupE / UreJ protein